MKIPLFEYYCGGIREANQHALTWGEQYIQKNGLRHITEVKDGVTLQLILLSCGTIFIRELTTSLSRLLSNQSNIGWRVYWLIDHVTRILR